MDRRLPGSMMDREERQTPYAGLITKILIIAAVVASLALGALIYLPGETVLVHFWIYFVAAALPIALLFAAIAVKLHASIKKRVPRIIAVSVAAFLMMVVVVVTYSISAVYSQLGANPAAYYTHQGTGNRLIIIKAPELDDEAADISSIDTYAYGAYPMKNRFFYYPLRGESASTKTGIDYVEWAEDGMTAYVYITDTDGNQQTLTVSFREPVPEDAESGENGENN